MQSYSLLAIHYSLNTWHTFSEILYLQRLYLSIKNFYQWINIRFNFCFKLPPQDTKDMHECPYCRQPCSNDRISEHVKNCSDNYFECHMCGENVSEKNRDIHGSLQCRVLLDYGPESFCK